MFDDQFDLVSGLPTSYRPSRVWAHPIVADLSNLGFLTSCTIQSPIGSDVIIGRGMGVEPVEYSHVNFFGNMKADPWEKWGCFNQMAAVSVDFGRLVAFSDSTIFSNFCMFFDAKPALAVRTVFFLSHRPGVFERRIQPWMGRIALVIISLSLLFCVLFGSLTALRTAIMGICLVGLLVVVKHVSAAQFRLPPRTAKDAVFFESALSSFKLPAMLDWSPAALKDPHAFDSFFINMSRMGLEPYVDNPLDLQGSPRLRCIIYPNSEAVSSAEYAALIDKIRKGHRLLILVEWGHSGHLAFCKALLSLAGIAHSWSEQQTKSCAMNAGKHVHRHLVVNKGGGLCSGGDRHEFDASVVPLGKGKIYFLGGARMFSREGFGQVYSSDKPETRALANLQYALVDYAAGTNVCMPQDISDALNRYLDLGGRVKPVR